jgi:hypothetical protein
MKTKIKDSVLQLGTGNISIFKSKDVTVNQVQALDQLNEFLKNGDTSSAVDLLKSMKDFMDSQHPAAPYYKYDFGVNEEGQKYISHVPAFPGAEKLAPLKGNMKITVPTKYQKFKNMREIINYSYGMQEEIEFDLQSLKTWVGDTVIEEFEGNEQRSAKIKIRPSEFPPPSPMKLYLKDNSWSIDYLMVGVSRIDNNIITLNNAKQSNSHFLIEIILDLENTRANFNINITEHGLHSVGTILKFKEIIDNSSKKNKPRLALKLLESDSDFIMGAEWQFNDNVTKEQRELLEYLKKLYFIEEELNVEFHFPERLVTDWEIYIVDVIYQTLIGKEYETALTEGYHFELSNKHDIQRLIRSHKEHEVFNVGLNFINTEPFELFGVKFISKSNNVFLKSVMIQRFNRLVKKAELLDEGEPLRISLIPVGSDSTFNEKLVVVPNK